MSEVTRICFVCLGNIVRSPLAEHLFQKLAGEAGVAQHYETDSAGMAAWHIGEAPDGRMRRVAARRGLEYSGSARQFTRDDFGRFDLIIAMDLENRSDLRRLARTPAQEEMIHTLREFDPDGGPRAAVPDPYYGGIDGFEETYQIIERSCKKLLADLETGKLQKPG